MNINDQAEDARQWLPVREAAAALNVTPKTIRRRIGRGELEARKVSRGGGGIGWLVQIGSETPIVKDTERDISTPTKGTSQHSRNAHVERETPSERDMGAERNAHEKDGDRMSDLRDEVKFLRGVIEQLQRDGAETRAALREALKSKAPQLTQGSASVPREATQTTAADNHSHADQTGQQGPAKRENGSLTYGDIADELEQRLNQA